MAKPKSSSAKTAKGLNEKRWWQKDRVQTALATGILGIIGVIVSGLFIANRQPPAVQIPAERGSPSSSPAEEAEVRRVVKESQLYECLGLYTEPKAFDRNQLRKYWVMPEHGGQEVEKIEASIQRLLNKGWRYGKDSKLERFEFRSVRISPRGDTADVETRERWYLPLYREDGSRVLERNAHLNTEPIYTLRKVNGIWLIQATTNPRPESN